VPPPQACFDPTAASHARHVRRVGGSEVQRKPSTRDQFGGNRRYSNPLPRIILELADCSERINLEFDVHSDLELENSLHKVDAIVAALRAFRAGLVEETRLPVACQEGEGLESEARGEGAQAAEEVGAARRQKR
jgi:hypothetical protein